MLHLALLCVAISSEPDMCLVCITPCCIGPCSDVAVCEMHAHELLRDVGRPNAEMWSQFHSHGRHSGMMLESRVL